MTPIQIIIYIITLLIELLIGYLIGEATANRILNTEIENNRKEYIDEEDAIQCMQCNHPFYGNLKVKEVKDGYVCPQCRIEKNTK